MSSPLELSPIKGCPAFNFENEESKCPFKQEKLKELLKTCPAFKDGCALKDVKTTKDLRKRLQDMPETHSVGPINQEVSKVMAMIHKAAKAAAEEHGKCPVFANACPFKTICTNGRPLMKELEYRQWFPESLSVEFEDEDEGHLTRQLSSQLKEGTIEVHQLAEGSKFMEKFVKGEVTIEAYKIFLSQLYYIYEAMEEETEKHFKSNMKFEPVYCGDVLNRLETIKADLRYYYGEDYKETMYKMMDSAKAYVDRLHTVSAKNPLLLLAHTYTRYLGDVSGGQVLLRKVRKAFKFPRTQTDGVQFYIFSIPRTQYMSFKKHWRNELDNMGVTTEEADAIVQEAVEAFKCNIAVFDELDDLLGHVRSKPPPKSASQRARDAGCPFAHLADAFPDSGHGTSKSTATKGGERTLVSDLKVFGAVVLAVAMAVLLRWAASSGSET